jgi:hypothetical protein
MAIIANSKDVIAKNAFGRNCLVAMIKINLFYYSVLGTEIGLRPRSLRYCSRDNKMLDFGGKKITLLGSKNKSTKREIMSDQKQTDNDIQDLKVSLGVGATVGAGASALVGGMGLAVGGTAVGIGMAPVTAVGAVVGTAAYGLKKAIEDKDTNAIGAVTIGAGAGAGVSALVGGMGLAVGGTAVAVTMAPVAVVGAVIGLAGYGISKLFKKPSRSKKSRRKNG